MTRHLTITLALAGVLAGTAACKKSKPAATTPTAPTTTTTRPAAPGGDTDRTPEVVTREPVTPSERTDFGPVYFEFDSALLSAPGRDEVARAADHLASARDRITVEGHTDERGTTEYNLALGQQRANAVAAYLRGLGVPDDRIDTITYGEERPAALGDDEAAWARNRRAELKVHP